MTRSALGFYSQRYVFYPCARRALTAATSRLAPSRRAERRSRALPCQRRAWPVKRISHDGRHGDAECRWQGEPSLQYGVVNDLTPDRRAVGIVASLASVQLGPAPSRASSRRPNSGSSRAPLFLVKGFADFAEPIHDYFGRDLSRIMVFDELLAARGPSLPLLAIGKNSPHILNRELQGLVQPNFALRPLGIPPASICAVKTEQENQFSQSESRDFRNSPSQ